MAAVREDSQILLLCLIQKRAVCAWWKPGILGEAGGLAIRNCGSVGLGHGDLIVQKQVKRGETADLRGSVQTGLP